MPGICGWFLTESPLRLKEGTCVEAATLAPALRQAVACGVGTGREPGYQRYCSTPTEREANSMTKFIHVSGPGVHMTGLRRA